MEEIWKDVVGYEGKYQVSNLGNVRNSKGKILKPQERRHGYLSVWLYGGDHLKGRTGKAFSIHRIVAEAFLTRPNGCNEVNHKDECKQNNCADNLEWCTHKENSAYGNRPKTISEKNTNGKRSKSVAQYTLDGVLICVFPSLQEAGRYGFHAGNICNCAKGHPRYSHAYGYVWKYV